MFYSAGPDEKCIKTATYYACVKGKLESVLLLVCINLSLTLGHLMFIKWEKPCV
jgi:hypothetical protein